MLWPLGQILVGGGRGRSESAGLGLRDFEEFEEGGAVAEFRTLNMHIHAQ